MRALDRKLFRDIARMRAQVAAIAVVVASGVALFVATMTAYRALQLSEDAFYRDQRFAHVWSSAARVPNAVARELAAIPDVTAIDARLVVRAILDVPGLVEPASALLIAIPPTEGHAVNDVYVRRGRHVERGRPGEVLVSEAFAEKNRLGPGDGFHAVVAGHRVALRVVGVALSPEYVMPLEPGALVSDEERFAILWMERSQLEALLDLRDTFNSVAFLLAPAADERAVITSVDRILEPYGGRGAHGRASQASHVMLEEHVLQLRSLALLVPTIFLLVAAFLVSVVMSRLIATQREQIGMLKAFGYSNARVALHYLELTVIVVILGVIAGVPVGAWLGELIAEFYARFFRFPFLIYTLEPSIVALGVALATVAALAGALGTLRRVAAMQPIVAMTPEIPRFRDTLLDRLGITSLLSPVTRMIVRNLVKRPLRSGLASIGMALAIAVVVLGSSSADAIDQMKDVQFQAAQREDMSITFAEPRALGTLHDLRALPGVVRAEPYRIVPARILANAGRADITLFGLPDDGVLRRPVDNAFRPAPRLGNGIILTAWTARTLGLAPGDVVSIEIRERERWIVTTRIDALVDEPLGEAAYMEIRALGRLLREPETYNGANLAIDPERAHELYARIKQTPLVIAIGLRRGALANYDAMGRGAIDFIRVIEVLFSVVIAFGIVYNTARIALAERGRELATLRVLGFTRREASGILLGEIAILAAPAIPLGFLFGYGLTGVVAVSLTGSRMHIPVLVATSTYAFAVVVFLAAALVSALVVRRRIDRLDLVEVLKARE
jgi:putative ABC transport system permease protein